MVVKFLGYITKIYESLKYQLVEEKETKQSKLVACGGIDPGGNLYEIAQDFKHVASLRGSTLKNRYAHIVISHPQEEHISDKKAIEIAEDLIDELEFSSCQFTMTRHIDFDKEGHEDGRHYHITLNRVRPDGELVDDSFIGLKLHLINEMLEKKHQLRVRKRDRSNSRREGIKYLIQERWRNRSLKSMAELKEDLFEQGYKSYLTEHGEKQFLTVCDRKSPIKFSYELQELNLEQNKELKQEKLMNKNYGL